MTFREAGDRWPLMGAFDRMPHINSYSHLLKHALQIQAAGWGVLVELGPLLDKVWTADAAGIP